MAMGLESHTPQMHHFNIVGNSLLNKLPSVPVFFFFHFLSVEAQIFFPVMNDVPHMLKAPSSAHPPLLHPLSNSRFNI